MTRGKLYGDDGEILGDAFLSVDDQNRLNVVMEGTDDRLIVNELALPVRHADQAAISALRAMELWKIAGELFADQMKAAFQNGLTAHHIVSSKKPVRDWSKDERDAVDNFLDKTLDALKKWTDFMGSDVMERMTKLFPDFESWLIHEAPPRNSYALILFGYFSDVLRDAIDYIESEAVAVKSWKPGNYTFKEFITPDQSDDHKADSHFERAFRKSKNFGLQDSAAGKYAYLINANDAISYSLRTFTVGDVIDGKIKPVTFKREKDVELSADVLLTCMHPELYGITDSTSPDNLLKIRSEPAINEFMLGILNVFGTIAIRAIERNEPFPWITREQINGFLNGNKYDDSSLSPARLQLIHRCIMILNTTPIRHDVDRVLKEAGCLLNDDEYSICGQNLLNVLWKEQPVRGRKDRDQIRYTLLSMPPTFAIAQRLKQFTFYPLSVLSAPSSGSLDRGSVNRINIKLYLARRVTMMRYSNANAADAYRKQFAQQSAEDMESIRPIESFRNVKPIIVIDNLLRATGNSTTDRTLRKRNIDYIEQLLKYWTTIKIAGGAYFIRDFSFQLERGKKTKIIITL